MSMRLTRLAKPSFRMRLKCEAKAWRAGSQASIAIPSSLIERSLNFESNWDVFPQCVPDASLPMLFTSERPG
jgi:hypothetical protein